MSEERAVMHLLDSMGLNRSGQKRSLKVYHYILIFFSLFNLVL